MYIPNAKVLKVGDILPSKMTGNFKIVAIKSSTKVDISFVDNPLPIQTITATRARRGNVSDPFYPTVNGRGYYGVGEHASFVNDNSNKIYRVWRGILDRAYSDDINGNNATSVCDEWLNFQTFADWYIDTLGDIQEDMTVVFDVLIPTAKVYSPEYTTMVPTCIHKILINNSAKGKEARLPKGVSEARDNQGRFNGMYKAYICLSGKRTYLGWFHNPYEASNAYNAAKIKHVRDMTKQYKHIMTEETYRALLKWTPISM